VELIFFVYRTKADSFVKLHYVDHLIMQYMDVKDLLVMSEVSVDWNERAEKKLLNKILKLSLKDEMKDEDFAALMESERNYESVELVYSEENYDLLIFGSNLEIQ